MHKKKEVEPKINKFRSFAIFTKDSCIIIKNKKNTYITSVYSSKRAWFNRKYANCGFIRTTNIC